MSLRIPVTFLLPQLDREGVLLDVRGDRIQVQFRGEDPPILALGSYHPVRLILEEIPREISTEARTVFRQEGQGGKRSYGFLLDVDLEHELAPKGTVRDGYRVRPPRRGSLKVEIHVGDEEEASLEGEIENLSLVGVLLRVTPEVESALAGHSRLVLTAHLPQSHEPIRIAGHVRHRRLADPDIQLGIEFDPSSFPTQRERNERELARYIMSRQLDQLRRKAG